MKKKFLIPFLCIGVMLTGCGNSSSRDGAASADTSKTAEAIEETTENKISKEEQMPAEIIPDKIGVLSDARMNFQGISRLYSYYVPSDFHAEEKLPLMITLHGQGFGAVQQLKDSQFDILAETEKFVMIAPNCVTIDAEGNLASEGLTFFDLPDVGAANRRWNIKNAIHDMNGVDDIAYISALIDLFADRYNIDTDRVYVSGLSNGALMSIRLSVELSDKIAGIGAVAGTLPYDYMKNKISSPMKIVLIQGDADPTVPIEGYTGYSPSIWEAAKWYNEQFNVAEDAVKTELPQTVEGDTTKVVKYEWPEKSGSQVVLYVIEGGGHTWPGGTQYFPEARIGKLSMHYSASKLIWDELKNFHK